MPSKKKAVPKKKMPSKKKALTRKSVPNKKTKRKRKAASKKKAAPKRGVGLSNSWVVECAVDGVIQSGLSRIKARDLAIDHRRETGHKTTHTSTQ